VNSAVEVETKGQAAAALIEPGPYGQDVEGALRMWIALARAYGTVSRSVATKVAEYELTTSQFGILEALHHLGPLTLGELADKLLVTGGNVTYVMDRLQRDGLVTRRRCSQDRRVVWAELTPDGRALIEEVFPQHAEFLHDTLGVLDSAERAELRTLLKKLGKGIQARLAAAPEDAR